MVSPVRARRATPSTDATRVTGGVEYAQLDSADPQHVTICQRREGFSGDTNLRCCCSKLLLMDIRWHRADKVTQTRQHYSGAHWHVTCVANVVIMEVRTQRCSHIAPDHLGSCHHSLGVIAWVNGHTLACHCVADQIHEVLHALCHREDLVLLSVAGMFRHSHIPSSKQLVEDKSFVAEGVRFVRQRRYEQRQRRAVHSVLGA